MKARGIELRAKGKVYLQSLFPILHHSWINSFNKGQVPILHECGTEKIYFECENLSLRKYLSTLLIEEESITFKGCQLESQKNKGNFIAFICSVLLSRFLCPLSTAFSIKFTEEKENPKWKLISISFLFLLQKKSRLRISYDSF